MVTNNNTHHGAMIGSGQRWVKTGTHALRYCREQAKRWPQRPLGLGSSRARDSVMPPGPSKKRFQWAVVN